MPGGGVHLGRPGGRPDPRGDYRFARAGALPGRETAPDGGVHLGRPARPDPA